MSKSSVSLARGGAALLAVTGTLAMPTSANAVAACTPGKPSVIVHVAGFKEASGRVNVTLYGSDTRLWLAKGGRINKVKIPVTGTAMDICMPVPAPGRYAVAVHHDLNVNGQRDRRDGGGYSRNPKVSLLNPKPAFSKAAFEVGKGPTRVGVRLLYVKGLGVGPVTS